MTDFDGTPDTAPEPGHGTAHIGDRLRAAREGKGLSLPDIAAQTKVPVRLLGAIERGAVEELPVGPYAIGFARSYARAVGLDEQVVADDVRALQQQRNLGLVSAMTHYEPADPSRVPPRSIALIAAIAGILMIGGYIAWRSLSDMPDTAPIVADATPSTTETVGAATPLPAAAAAPLADGAPVVIVASDKVWFSLENAQGRSQVDLTLNAGEFYTLKPQDRALFLRTGRPQSLRIKVGEQTLPALGAPDTIISKVALDTASLGRVASGAAAPAAPAPAPAAAPAAGQ